MRGRKIYIILVLMAVLGGTWLKLKSPENQKVASAPLEKLTIANVGEYSIFNIVAKEKGYFEKHGIDAKIVEYASGPPAVADLLAGKADVAVAADFVGIRNMFNNEDLRILGQASRHEVFNLIARKDKGIGRPEDLKGKTVGVTQKTVGEFFLGLTLTFYGLGLNDINLAYLDPSEIVVQIKEGKIDAAIIFEPHAYSLKKALGSNGMMWSAQNGQKSFALIYSTGSFIENSPSLVDRYLASLVDAERFVRENLSESREIISEKLHYAPDYIEYVWPKFDFAISLDQELLLTMEDEARWAIENHLTEAGDIPNYLNFISFEALEKAKPESVSIIH